MSATGMTGRLTVGVVGAGTVGAVLGQALAAAGHHLVGYSTSSAKNIERAEVLLPAVPRLDVAQVVQAADFVIFALPSDQLVEVIAGIARAGLFKPGQLLAHTSADFGFSVFDPAIATGVIPLAIHPAMNFTGTSIDLARLRESFFAVAAPNVAIPIAQALVIEMGGEPFVVTEENRQKYAEAISVADNFSKMIVSQSIGLLEEVGLVDARAILAPLLRSAVEQALALGHQPIDPDELLA
ncbi:DUF2520 domain-containing protein [Candidatus Rhodoluna planktonica]|uniref:Oxidoreductase n=1 Tax=Candidatus Rhodoluna planktonica TaxID=535712 RepID=A0A1D9DXN9_9MICO|nr:DUF2520 domain-containing protein [Candidatus Rhodoluna planktonica]AOY55565.1 hypothetical protein A4Z71_00675 [Candidatus Rhodoluna planktonica]